MTYNSEDSQYGLPYSSSLSNSKKRKTDYFTKSSNDHNPEIIAINSLDIADGLKELLIKYRFTLKELLSIPASELSEFLGVDLYVAKIICGAARKLSNYNYHI
ncbi:MAG TPA: hypothetical protein VFR94_24080 [Nitrososphaeraceae archaeon]|nr:hypothetical protein [Nitrososphaeraceae archaeon]